MAQEKDLKAQAEERFKTAVTALGDEKEGAQVGGAILLRSFLNKDDEEIYGRYYTQIFDLAVAYLRLPRTAHPPENPDGPSSIPEQSRHTSATYPLSQTLIDLFKETFPLARDQKKEENQVLNTTNVQLVAGEDENFQFPETTMVRPGKHYDNFQSLNASGVQLDNAYLRKADLEQVWMPDSFLRKVDLWWADLRGANFNGSNLSEARLVSADLSGAYLSGANLSGAYLSGAKLIEATLVFATLDRADLSGANLSGANLNQVTLSKADLGGANLSRSQFIQDNLGGANLSGANFNMANLSGANLKGADLSPVGTLRGANLSYTDLSGVQFNKVTKLRGAHLKGADLTRSNFGEVLSMEGADFGNSGIKPLEGTDLREVKGLTKKQLITCKAKGAIIDEDLTTSASLSPVSPSPPSQSKEVQAPSASTVQASQPTPDAGRSSNASSFQLGSEP